MKTKTCTACAGNFPETSDFFHRNKNNLIARCKKCISKYRKQNYKRWKLKEYNKQYLQKNPDKAKQYIENSKEKKRKYFKKWYQNNKEKQSIKHKKWRVENLEKHRNNFKKWKEKNNRKEYFSHRRKKNLNIKLIDNIRRRVNHYIKFKNKHTIEYLGIDMECYRKYLESLFEKGMSWSNYGVLGWHIDHIIPLSSAENEEELIKLFHYSNTQPLWAKDNLKKSNKI